LIQKAASRVARAASFDPLIRQFVALKYAVSSGTSAGTEIRESRAASAGRIRLSTVEDPVLRGMLAIDAGNADGAPTYLALRDYYLALAKQDLGGWARALYLGEAYTFTRLAELVYETPGADAFAKIFDGLTALERSVTASGDGALVSYYRALMDKTERALKS
jgi:hypothetical protein